jgi:UDP-N-acetylenolpyruvoylglucosamine reductase
VYPAFEKQIAGGDIADLYLEFRNLLTNHAANDNRSCKLILSRDIDEAWKHMYLTQEPGDTLILLGAGDIIKLVPSVIKDMSLLEKNQSCIQRTPISLADFSSFRTGGITFGKLLRSKPPTPHQTIIVGAGTNTWFSDCATDADVVLAPSGSNAAQSGASVIKDYPQLAFMSGIPGTVGGWTKMNAGAFGDSVGNYIDYVVVDGEKISASDCGFDYRKSTINGLITHVEFKAELNESQSLPSEHYLSRRKKFPPRTCGSVFKNPSPETPAGQLLEESGAKSLKVGGAHVWNEHANVILATDNCTSSDILALARLMAARVKEKFGITLHPEICGLEV